MGDLRVDADWAEETASDDSDDGGEPRAAAGGEAGSDSPEDPGRK